MSVVLFYFCFTKPHLFNAQRYRHPKKGVCMHAAVPFFT